MSFFWPEWLDKWLQEKAVPCFQDILKNDEILLVDSYGYARTIYILGELGEISKGALPTLESLKSDIRTVYWNPNAQTASLFSGSDSIIVAQGDDPTNWLREISIGDLASESLRKIKTKIKSNIKKSE